MPLPVVTEAVRRADQRRRWHEVGRVLFAGEPRWAPPLRSYETWLVSRRHPYRRATGAALERWLARRGGRVVGRVAAHHVDGDEVAWFGGLEVGDDPAAVAALLGEVGAWAGERGAAVVRGPALYLPADGDAGVLTEGFAWPGGTARPWHPPWYGAHLAAAGLAPWGDPLPRWRLATSGVQEADASVGLLHTRGRAAPPHAGRLADRRLVLDGIAAVPDVSAVARGQRRRHFDEAAVVHVAGDPAAAVPALLAAAAAAGYAAVWAPWCPDPRRAPDTVHRLHEMVADRNRLP